MIKIRLDKTIKCNIWMDTTVCIDFYYLLLNTINLYRDNR